MGQVRASRNVIQVLAVGLRSCNYANMSMWIVILLICLLVVLARVDSRDQSGQPVRKWNIWFGPSPKSGETQIRYLLRRALAALATFAVMVMILYFVPPTPDEGTSFRGNESIVSLVAVIVCTPLSGLAFVVFATSLLKTAFLAVFRRGYVFDEVAGIFQRTVNQSVPR